MADHYGDGTCQWWHLSQPPPELVAALGDGWLPGGGRILDIGCGLGTEAGYLATAGWQAAGIDLSGTGRDYRTGLVEGWWSSLRTLIVRDRGYGAWHGYRTLPEHRPRLS